MKPVFYKSNNILSPDTSSIENYKFSKMVSEMRYSPVCLFYILAATLVLTILYLRHKKPFGQSKRKLPPGEMGFPLIGQTMEFYKAQQKNNLFDGFIKPRIARYGKIFTTHLMGSPTVIVNGANANRFLLSNEFKLVISSWPSASVQLMGKDSIMEKQGERHRCLHGLIGASLGQAGLEAMVPKICNSMKMHLDTKWKCQDEISLYRATKVLTFTIVFECLLGINTNEDMLGTFERVLEGVFAAPVNFPGSKFWRAKKARKQIEKMLVQIVREKKMQMEECNILEEVQGATLLSRLVAGMIKGEVTEEEVVDNVVLLVFAAHDSTSFAIAMAFKMLAHHPDCHSLLLQEHAEVMRSKKNGDQNLTLDDTKKMNYTWQVARESMRLFPPIFGSFRKSIADIEYEGFTIPKGWNVLWTTYGTHYNSEYFEDPSSFNPSRFDGAVPPYAFLAFGGGPRLCAGYQLAKLNILIFIHFIVTRYDWSLLYPDEPISMDPLPFPSYGMPIKITPKFL